jgi:ParB family chromosome partitioning protein
MRQALGKGLDALFKQSQTTATLTQKEVSSARKIPLSKIKPNKHQPRRIFSEESLAELAQSIKQHGLAQPIALVYDKERDEYEIIAGERRFRASQLAGLDEIDAVVRPRPSDEEMLALALIENIQREDLNPIDTALAFRKLMEKFSVPQAGLARYCGKSRAAVSNCLRLLELEAEIQKSLQEGHLTEGHARALLMVTDRAARLRIFHETLTRQYSVRQLEDACRVAAQDSPKAATKRVPAARSADILAAEERLRRSLGTKVEIKPKNKGGTLVIHYSSVDEINSIYRKLSGEA